MRNEKLKIVWFIAARCLCKVFCRLFFRMRFYGIENVPETGPLLIVSNHQSFLDPIFCGLRIKRPINFVARDSLLKIRFVGTLIRSLNIIPVKRGQADLKAMKMVISRLKAGGAVCLFPEGTRSADGKIADFKGGFGLLCRRGGAAVVPVVIDGAFESWPRHKKFFKLGSAITVSYGKCMTADEVSQLGNKELAEMLTVKLREMQNECRKKIGRETYSY